MNVGDKVRMLRGKEEGIITRIIDQKLIEIEIEDGFQIPVLKSEVVVVAREEADYFKKTTPEAVPLPPAPLKKAGGAPDGHYIAYKPLNDRQLSIHLINNTSDVLLYSILEEKGGSYIPLASGQLKAQQAHKFAQADLQQFDQWPVWHVRLLAHPSDSAEQMPAPIQQRLQPKANSFFRSLRTSPVLNSKAYLISLNASGKLPAEEAQNLQDKITNKQETKQLSYSGRVPAEVDLHLEKLTDQKEGLSNTEILQLQLSTFEQALDRAMAAGLEEITFIHGVGNGTLRKEIHRRLGSMKAVAWFKDDQKEKWGYGATRVRLK